MMRTSLSLAVAVAAAIASPAVAQDNPYGGGSRLDRDTADVERSPGNLNQQDRARATLDQYARCMIKKQRATATKFVESPPWTETAKAELDRMVDERCLSTGELSFPADLLRGAVFQELYREKYSGGPPALPAAAIDFTDGAQGPLGDTAAVQVAMLQFGDCVARRDLPNSHALVLARPGTSQETSAINALLPDFAACLVQGSTWKITKSVMASIMSEVLYREGDVAKAPILAGGSAH